MKTKEQELLTQLTTEVIEDHEEELKAVLKESIKKAIERGCGGYFDSLESSIKTIAQVWVKENLKELIEKELEAQKPNMIKQIRASFLGAATKIGSAFLAYIEGLMTSDYERGRFFDRIFKDS